MGGGCEWKSRKERGAGGRWKLSAYKVAIRRKWPCVRQEEHLFLLPQHTKDQEGRGGGLEKNHSLLHEQGPTKHHTLDFNGPIWGFQSPPSLAFEKARQESAQRVTRGPEEETDLRGWRRRRSPTLPSPLLQPSQFHAVHTHRHMSGQRGDVVDSCWMFMLNTAKEQNGGSDHTSGDMSRGPAGPTLWIKTASSNVEHPKLTQKTSYLLRRDWSKYCRIDKQNKATLSSWAIQK